METDQLETLKDFRIKSHKAEKSGKSHSAEKMEKGTFLLWYCRRLPPVTGFFIKSQREIMRPIHTQECYRSNRESLSGLKNIITTYDKGNVNYTTEDRRSICLR